MHRTTPIERTFILLSLLKKYTIGLRISKKELRQRLSKDCWCHWKTTTKCSILPLNKMNPSRRYPRRRTPMNFRKCKKLHLARWDYSSKCTIRTICIFVAWRKSIHRKSTVQLSKSHKPHFLDLLKYWIGRFSIGSPTQFQTYPGRTWLLWIRTICI